ncbi:MAG TPA: N-acetylmuramoyl-L-alanine amidase [Candidatus Binatia bacterium]|nr:N-acetylmuramoyl-L-alanine amidase [Candidatus Binatia bacterium]
MASVKETKALLLRGVVQDNLDALYGARKSWVKRRRRRIELWLSLGTLGIAAVFFLIPSHVVSTGSGPAPRMEPTSFDLSAAVEPTPESAAPLAHPRPIDRNAIPLAIRTIVIDPGHGGDPGALSESGVTEKEITLDVALRLRRLLKDSPFEVLLTRESDRWISLDKRVAFANQHKADLFISIHVNWMEPQTVRALETYYVGPTDDPATLKLASRENKDSELSLSDYKHILEKIYVDARRDESRALARAIQSQLYHSLKAKNPQLLNRGVKTAPFVVLIGTEMPAILVEIACLSNQDEVELLTKEDYRESIALGLLRGIRSYASSLNNPVAKGG